MTSTTTDGDNSIPLVRLLMKASFYSCFGALAVIALQACSADLNRPRAVGTARPARSSDLGAHSDIIVREQSIEDAATQELLNRYPGPAGEGLKRRLARPMSMIQLPADSVGQALLDVIYHARLARGAELTRRTAPIVVGLVVRDAGGDPRSIATVLHNPRGDPVDVVVFKKGEATVVNVAAGLHALLSFQAITHNSLDHFARVEVPLDPEALRLMNGDFSALAMAYMSDLAKAPAANIQGVGRARLLRIVVAPPE